MAASSEKNSVAVEDADGAYADAQSFYHIYEYGEVDAISKQPFL